MNPQEQFKEVQSIVDRLTRFRHINGWAAVAAGILSLIAFAYINYTYQIPWLVDNTDSGNVVSKAELTHYFMVIGGLLITASIICGIIILSSLPKDLTQAALRNLLKLGAFFALYIVSGFAILWAVISGSETITIGLLRSVPPMMCILYGLAHIQASHISLPALKYLGFACFFCGLVGAILPMFAWPLWAVGFGIGHIVLGFYLVKKHPN